MLEHLAKDLQRLILSLNLCKRHLHKLIPYKLPQNHYFPFFTPPSTHFTPLVRYHCNDFFNHFIHSPMQHVLPNHRFGHFMRLFLFALCPVHCPLQNPCPEHLPSFVYGLPEAHVSSAVTLAGAKRIANPGCFATAIALALLPLVALPYDFGRIHISAVTGSSGSGTQPSAGTHHPSRAHDFRAYKILTHQHESEIRACLADAALRAGEGARAPQFSLVPHSAPMVRGIFATCQFELPGLTAETLMQAYRQHYQHSRFLHVLDESPRAAAVAGSNFCELSIHVVGGSVAVLCAIDNLGKGMAGQAVQNMNLSLALPEATGLMAAALFP